MLTGFSLDNRALTLAFMLAQGVYLARHMQPQNSTTED